MISGKQICKKPKKDIIQQENYLKIVFLPLYLLEKKNCVYGRCNRLHRFSLTKPLFQCK